MKDFGGETPYSVMFGPDICGFGTRKTHVIFNYKEKNHLVKKDIKCETDQLSHVYTLRLMPNNTYEVRTGSWRAGCWQGRLGVLQLAGPQGRQLQADVAAEGTAAGSTLRCSSINTHQGPDRSNPRCNPWPLLLLRCCRSCCVCVHV